MHCQCIVSEHSCGRSPYIFEIYLLNRGPQFEKTGLGNLENLLFFYTIFSGFGF